VKRVILKESHAPYTLAIEEEALSREPFILERDGEPVAVVIPMAEYQDFRAWREARDREEQRRKDLEAFEQERQAFERLKPELLRTHRGQWVAVYQEKVVEAGQDRSQVLDSVYDRFGYVPVYVQKVEEQPRVYKLPHRKVVR
jgi:PHD/YefM family antitoxin component YafN of YafNO toxin-antitoxin module